MGNTVDKFTHTNSAIVTHPIVLALGWANYFKFNYEIVTSHECVIYANGYNLVVTYNSSYVIVSRVTEKTGNTTHYYSATDDDDYMDYVLDCASAGKGCAAHTKVQIVSDGEFKSVLHTMYEIAIDANFDRELALFRDWLAVDIIDAHFIVSNNGDCYTVTYWRKSKPYDLFFINFPNTLNAITIMMNLSRLARKRLPGYLASKSVGDFCIDF